MIHAACKKCIQGFDPIPITFFETLIEHLQKNSDNVLFSLIFTRDFNFHVPYVHTLQKVINREITS